MGLWVKVVMPLEQEVPAIPYQVAAVVVTMAAAAVVVTVVLVVADLRTTAE
jgi:hypothetical protein